MARKTVSDSGKILEGSHVEQKQPDQTPGTSYEPSAGISSGMGPVLDPGKDLDIDIDRLQSEFRRYPSVLKSYNEAKSTAEKFHANLKLVLEELEAETYLRIKNGAEKVTEAQASALVTGDPKVKQKRREIIDSARDFDTVKNNVKSLEAKKDMLIQLGADARKEA